VTAIIAVCESIKRGLVAQGVPAGKIEVIYSGTDTDRFHPSVDGRAVRHELGLAPDDFLVTQVGVRSWRGNDDVLDAMAKVVPRLSRARLLIVGANDEKRRILGEKARARGLGGALSVFGYRQDVPEILAATDVSVDASYAGLGLTGSLRESLAVGTPVVATRIEGNPELVAHGEHGLLVPPRDPSTLADAVLEMAAAGPDRRQAMGMAGRRTVEARFSMAVKIARTEALYRRVLG
jgi:glycosyltransferase involved in cell wall biosynthesis